MGDDIRDVAKRLNASIRNSNPDWARLDLLDSFGLAGRISPIHQALSMLIAILQDAPVIATSALVTLGENDYDTAGFDLTLLSSECVVRVTRSGGDKWPAARVWPRESLQSLEVLRAPVVTVSDFAGARSEDCEIQLTFPGHAFTLRDSDGARLAEEIPALLADMRAGPN